MALIWQALETLAAGYQLNTSLAAVPAKWRELANGHYDAMHKAFLRTTDQPAFSYPCPLECGCAHEIIRHDSGRIVAVCRCEPWNCDDIPLEPADTMLVELNWPKLGRAIASALDCDVANCTALGAGTFQVATFGGAGLPVVLTIQQDRAGFAGVVAQLVATLKERFILLAPTNRFYDAHSQALLKGARAGFFSLESILDLTPAGKLTAQKTGGELFSPFLPEKEEAVKQSEFAWAFSVLQRLKSKRAGMKAPLYDVFVHTVQNRLSFREAAEKCECSLGLMATRVREMEKEFRLPLKELQAFGSTMLEMQTAVKGERRRKHKPGSRAGAFADDNPDDADDGDDDSAPAEEYRYEEGGQDD